MSGAAFFAHLQRGGGWMFAQGINGKKRVTQWIPPGTPFAYPRHWDGVYNVYFGVNQASAPVLDVDRAKYPGKRDAQIMPLVASKNDSISALNCLISEFDGKDFTYPTADELASAFAIVKADADHRLAARTLTKSLPEKALRNMAHNLAQNTKYATNPDLYKALAFAHVQGLPKQPSALVDSGGGYQAYWLLAETFHITNEDERTFAKDAQKRFTIGMGGDKSVKDLRRVLRMPGTLNVKPKYAPNYPRCNFVWCELDRLYTIDDLLAYLPEPVASDDRKESAGGGHRHMATDETERPQDLEDVRSLSRYAGWVAQEYNGRTKIATALLEAGYTWQGDRMSRPGEPDSKGVIVDTAGNTSFHFSGNDPLNGEHRRRSFDVLTCYDYNGDYEAAADAIGPALGIFRPEYVRATIAKGRAIVEFADWSQIVPIDKQSEIGYMTGQTDRKLFDNLLDVMSRAGRINGVTVGYRQLIAAKNADGQRVSIASVQTAKNFLDRLDGVLLTYETTDKGTAISLCQENISAFNGPVCNRLDTSSSSNESDEVSNLLQTGQIKTVTFRQQKADDAFATGTARWAREVIEAERQILMRDNPTYQAAAVAYKVALKSKPETIEQLRAMMGSELLTAYRELQARAAADFLPGLGTFGLLTILDLLDNPGTSSKDIATRRGLKVSSVRNVLQKLDRWELVDSYQEFGAAKLYFLVADVFGEIALKLPEAKTYNIGVQRLDTRLQADQVWAQKAAQEATSAEDRERAEKRINRLAHQRLTTVPVLHPDLSSDEIRRLVYTPHFIPTPDKVTAPAMGTPGAVAWDRLTSLTGKADLSEGELIELFALNDVLGAGIVFEPTLLWAHYQRWEADRHIVVDRTDRFGGMATAAELATWAF